VPQAGFCHRDVRWANVACSYDRRDYFLLDLEMCAPLDTDSAALSRLVRWPEDVLVGGRYTAASDLYCLGCLLEDCPRFPRFQFSAAGRDLFGRLRRPVGQQCDSAGQLLGHGWFAEEQ
jgi:hypothetical protein